MILSQSATDLQSIVSIDNATVTGVLIAVLIAFGGVIIYLFKYIQKMNADREILYKEFIEEVKVFNTNLMNVNKDYHDSISKITEMYRGTRKRT